MMEQLLGEIRLFPYKFEPRDWMECDGRLLPIMENQALFALIGCQYGGDGIKNFAIPKIDPMGTEETGMLKYYIAIEGMYPSRK